MNVRIITVQTIAFHIQIKYTIKRSIVQFARRYKKRNGVAEHRTLRNNNSDEDNHCGLFQGSKERSIFSVSSRTRKRNL